MVSPAGRGVAAGVLGHLDACSRCRMFVGGLLQSSGDQSPRGVRARAFRDGDLVAGRYRIDRMVGRGNMGDVYRAEDEVLKVRVALKTLSSQIADSPAATERLRFEVQLARRVSHPNVCRMFDIGLHPSTPEPLCFLTMEMLEGETLRDRLSRQALAPREAAHVALQMATALEAVHQGGVVHRDFKPENVMLVGGGAGEICRAVVLDFGLARNTPVWVPGTQNAEEKGTGGWTPSGTPMYMAPELRNGGTATPRSDVYAFGMVLLELMHGATAFAAGSSAGARPSREPLRRPEAEAKAAAEAVDRALSTLARRCIEADPTRRISSFQLIVDELRRRPNRRALGLATEHGVWASPSVRRVLVFAGALVATSVIAIGVRPPGGGSLWGLSTRNEPALPRVAISSPLHEPELASAQAIELAPNNLLPGPAHGAGASVLPLAPTPLPAPAAEPSALGNPAPRDGLPHRPPSSNGAAGDHRRRAPGEPARPESLARKAPGTPAFVPVLASPPTGQPTFAERLHDADGLLLDGNVARACAMGEQLRAEAPDASMAYRFLGKCYTRAGRFREARSNYSRYLQLAPNAEDAPFVRGIIAAP